jgi:hypothetical protein
MNAETLLMRKLPSWGKPSGEKKLRGAAARSCSLAFWLALWLALLVQGCFLRYMLDCQDLLSMGSLTYKISD